MNKRGVSAVVATVLIIMITVASVAILWSTVIPMIKDSLGSTTAEKVVLTIETNKGYTVWDEEKGVVSVQIGRGMDEANLTGMQIIFTINGTSLEPIEVSAPEPNQQSVFYFNLSQYGKPDKVTINPIYLIKGMEELGESSSEVTTELAKADLNAETLYFDISECQELDSDTNYRLAKNIEVNETGDCFVIDGKENINLNLNGKTIRGKSALSYSWCTDNYWWMGGSECDDYQADRNGCLSVGNENSQACFGVDYDTYTYNSTCFNDYTTSESCYANCSEDSVWFGDACYWESDFGAQGTGILLTNSRDINVFNGKIENFYYGLRLSNNVNDSSFDRISIDGGDSGYEYGTASDMYVDSYQSGNAIYVSTSKNDSFTNINIQRGGSYALRLNYVNDSTFEGISMNSSSSYGIYNYYSGDNAFSNLEITNFGYTALYNSRSSKNNFTDVSISGGIYGVYNYYYSSSNRFTNLDLSSLNTGVTNYNYANSNVFSTIDACTSVPTFSYCSSSTCSFSSIKCTSAGNCAGVSCQSC